MKAKSLIAFSIFCIILLSGCASDKSLMMHFDPEPREKGSVMTIYISYKENWGPKQYDQFNLLVQENSLEIAANMGLPNIFPNDPPSISVYAPDASDFFAREAIRLSGGTRVPTAFSQNGGLGALHVKENYDPNDLYHEIAHAIIDMALKLAFSRLPKSLHDDLAHRGTHPEGPFYYLESVFPEFVSYSLMLPVTYQPLTDGHIRSDTPLRLRIITDPESVVVIEETPRGRIMKWSSADKEGVFVLDLDNLPKDDGIHTLLPFFGKIKAFYVTIYNEAFEESSVRTYEIPIKEGMSIKEVNEKLRRILKNAGHSEDKLIEIYTVKPDKWGPVITFGPNKLPYLYCMDENSRSQFTFKTKPFSRVGFSKSREGEVEWFDANKDGDIVITFKLGKDFFHLLKVRKISSVFFHFKNPKTGEITIREAPLYSFSNE
jgi:hypothetical protein